MYHSRSSIDATPPASLLPSEAVQQHWADHIAAAPGFNLLAYRETDDLVLPENSYHVHAHIRPGFNGNLQINPYRTGTYRAPRYKEGRGKLMLQGYGHFFMVYENPEHMVQGDPADRLPPDYSSLRFNRPSTKEIALRSGGRLLVQQTIANRKGYALDVPIDPISQWSGVVVVDKIVHDKQVRPLMTHLAEGMGLQGADVITLADQPARKILPLMDPVARAWHTISRSK